MNTYAEIVQRFNDKLEQQGRNEDDVISLAKRLVHRVETRLEAPAGTVSWGVAQKDGTMEHQHFMFEQGMYRFTMQFRFPVGTGSQVVDTMVHVQPTVHSLRANVQGVPPVGIPRPVDIEESNLQALAEHVLEDIRMKILKIVD